VKSKFKLILIHSTLEKVFAQLDDINKTGIHLSESSMIMMGMKIDFTETVTKWQPPRPKEWETVGEAKLIIMSWYRMWFEISPAENLTIAKLSISYLPPKQWFYKILSFFFAQWYCNWCLHNILIDTKSNLEMKAFKQTEGGIQL